MELSADRRTAEPAEQAEPTEPKEMTASFPFVLSDFGSDVTCQACRENSRYRTRFQASSGNSDSANWPEYEAEEISVLLQLPLANVIK